MDKEKIISAAAYLWILFFLPLVLIPNSSFGRFHANQALINFIVAVAAGIITAILGWIPVIGALIKLVVWVLALAMTAWGIYTALTGQKRPYPYVGGFQIIK